MHEALSNQLPDMDYLNIRTLGVACKCVLRTCFVLLNNMYCIPTYVVWMVLIFPLRRYHPELYWKIEGHFFHWLLAMVSMWSWSAGYDKVESGRAKCIGNAKSANATAHVTDNEAARSKLSAKVKTSITHHWP